MESRELRYFVTVAEEMHVGRAAERLGMAQPPLSRAVQRLERDLGVALFDRVGRSLALTDAGEVLLAEGRVALDTLAAAERRSRRSGAGTGGAGAEPGLVLVTKVGASPELLVTLLDAYAAEPGAVRVDVLLCGVGEQERMLRDGRADVALLHRPFDSAKGLDSEDLVTERQVLLVRRGHPLLARSEGLTMAEVAALTDPPPARFPGPDGTYPPGPGVEVHDPGQLLQYVALGRACVVLPESATVQAGAGVAAVPLVDAPEVTTMIVWPPHSRSRALATLVRVATTV